MGANTPNRNLYLPGGGSSGTIVPDETADIDRINGNFTILDTWSGEVDTKMTPATNAEVNAGTIATKFITPSGLTSKVATQAEADAGSSATKLLSAKGAREAKYNPYAMAAGRATGPASGDVTVTFPEDRFSVTPIVTITPRVANKALVHIITSISATEVKVRLFDISNNTQTVGLFDWTAVQMSNNSAPG